MRNVLGGAGSYAALGARLVSPPPLSRRIGWVVHCGSDFPDPVRETIDSWDTACVLVETPDRLTTRGWNGYGENENRGERLPCLCRITVFFFFLLIRF